MSFDVKITMWGVDSSMQPIYVILLSSTGNELPILFLDI
jgi:hypothetical protein